MTAMQELLPVNGLASSIHRFALDLAHGPQVELPLIEFTLDGKYYRAILIRKGVRLVGRKHREPTENLCIGKIAVATDDGVRVLDGFHRIAAPAGVQRAGVALEDTIWVCIHTTPETDLTKMEALLTFPIDEEIAVALANNHSAAVLLASNAAAKLLT